MTVAPVARFIGALPRRIVEAAATVTPRKAILVTIAVVTVGAVARRLR